MQVQKENQQRDVSEDLEEKNKRFFVHSSELFMGYCLLNQESRPQERSYLLHFPYCYNGIERGTEHNGLKRALVTNVLAIPMSHD